MFRFILVFVLTLITISSFSQTYQDKDSISFSIVLKKSYATKDGYILKGYIVDIPYKKAKKLYNKKIQVAGKITIVKGVDNISDSTTQVKQGRNGDTKYILHTTILRVR